ITPIYTLYLHDALPISAKLLMLASEIETEEELPELKLTGPVIVMVKSPTFTVDEAECNAVPGDPEPELVTTNVPRTPELRLHLRSEEHTSELQSPDHLV